MGVVSNPSMRWGKKRHKKEKKSRQGALSQDERTSHAAFRVTCCMYKNPRPASASPSNAFVPLHKQKPFKWRAAGKYGQYWKNILVRNQSR